MAITFCIAKDLTDAMKATQALDLEEEIDNYFYEHKEYLGEEGKVLVELDPYGTKVFNRNEVTMLIQLCSKIQQLFDDEIISGFAMKFSHLCEMALKQGKTVVAIGD